MKLIFTLSFLIAGFFTNAQFICGTANEGGVFNKQAVITNASGMIIKKFLLIKGSQTINMETWKAGIYFIKTEDVVKKVIVM